MAAKPTITTGGTKMAGCARIAPAMFLRVVRIPSAMTAPATPAVGSPGPCPTRALLRALRNAARRCIVVSPGKR